MSNSELVRVGRAITEQVHTVQLLDMVYPHRCTNCSNFPLVSYQWRISKRYISAERSLRIICDISWTLSRRILTLLITRLRLLKDYRNFSCLSLLNMIGKYCRYWLPCHGFGRPNQNSCELNANISTGWSARLAIKGNFTVTTSAVCRCYSVAQDRTSVWDHRRREVESQVVYPLFLTWFQKDNHFPLALLVDSA